MKKLLLVAGFGFLAASAGAQRKLSPSHAHRTPPKASPAKEKFPAHFGTASFYANKFEGRRTANGEVFHQAVMTAACNIIPLNTWVRITNLRNKRKLVIKINDRMHPRNPRLIDLSHSAAKALHYTGYGIQRVKMEVLGKKLPPGLRFGVQPPGKTVH